MRSLVTGGAGFIGSHVARHCLESGHEVVVLGDLSGGFADQVPSHAHFVRGSVVDAQRVEALFDQYAFDTICHLAAYAAEGLSHFIRRFNYTNNLIGSVNLINEAVKHEVKCFVFVSSIAVYGAGQLPLDESLVSSRKIRMESANLSSSKTCAPPTKCLDSTTSSFVRTTFMENIRISVIDIAM